ncbi:MAG TPA: hemolysin family protein [Anaerolineae bacterium]|nr:hemolysin family protein [Anaerolineae bacterium]
MVFVLALIFANGLFAMSEIAVISARKARLKQQVEAGNEGAKAALALANNPSDFLSTVQIGITLIGILAGAFGGASVSAQIEPYISPLPIIGLYSETVSVGLVVAVITYLSLVIGELAPKDIALNNPEKIAIRVAKPLTLLATLTSPFVRLLTMSTKLVVRLAGVKIVDSPPITKDEIGLLMRQGAQHGIFEPAKEEIMQQVLELSERRINNLMTPRPDIAWLDINDTAETITTKLGQVRHSRFPVCRDELDNVVGIVLVRDLLDQILNHQEINLNDILQPALFVPNGLPVLRVLERFKEAQTQIALISDEYGTLEGLMTLNDLLEAIVGDIPELGDPPDPEATQRQDGSWLIDGDYPVLAFRDLLNIPHPLPDEDENFYETLGGFAMTYLERVPQTGDTFIWKEYKFEIVDMDWRRIDKILVTPL